MKRSANIRWSVSTGWRFADYQRYAASALAGWDSMREDVQDGASRQTVTAVCVDHCGVGDEFLQMRQQRTRCGTMTLRRNVVVDDRNQFFASRRATAPIAA